MGTSLAGSQNREIHNPCSHSSRSLHNNNFLAIFTLTLLAISQAVTPCESSTTLFLWHGGQTTQQQQAIVIGVL